MNLGITRGTCTSAYCGSSAPGFRARTMMSWLLLSTSGKGWLASTASGVGTVACLASQLGFDAIGIEIERPLVEIAEGLAAAHDVDTEFVCGSFVPHGTEVTVGTADDLAWLSTTGHVAYDELDLEPNDFDLIFAYPWPGEEEIIFDLFANHAATGALLLTYHGIEGVRLQRRVRN